MQLSSCWRALQQALLMKDRGLLIHIHITLLTPANVCFNLPVTSTPSRLKHALVCLCLLQQLFFFFPPAHKYDDTGHQPPMSRPVSFVCQTFVMTISSGTTVPSTYFIVFG